MGILRLASLSLVAALVASSGCAAAPASGLDASPPGDAAPDAGRLCQRHADCDDSLFCNGREQCTPTAPGADPSGCVLGTRPCPQSQMCVESTDRCVGDCLDADGDGACASVDCDDADAARYPGASELCDPGDRDEDCDPATFGFRDGDADGQPDVRCCNVSATGTRRCGVDCDDTRPGVSPVATETCNGLDDDCDGMTDEGVTRMFYPDADGDGFATSVAGAMGVTDCFAPAGTAERRGDCDDANGAVNPAATDLCTVPAVDEDCSGMANDPVGGCACQGTATRPCTRGGACAMGVEACDPSTGTFGACSVMPTAELCNGSDDDCDGMTDEGLQIACFVDADFDGYAASGARMTMRCVCPSGETSRPPMGAALDCDDAAANRSPGAAEVCNGFDEDCDSVPDDGLTLVRRYRDGDGDGFPGTAVMACQGDPGTSAITTDCNDGNSSVYPGQAGFFTNGYCLSPKQPCTIFATGGQGCSSSVSSGQCAGGDTTPALFDYDCNGLASPTNQTTSSCPSSGQYPGCACGTAGFFLSGATPACGAGAAYCTPRCDTNGSFPVCASTTTTMAFPCR